MLTLLAVSALAWELKSPFQAPNNFRYDLVVEATGGGDTHQAKMTYVVASQKTESGPAKVSFSWNELMVDESPVGEDMTWHAECNDAGFITKMEEGEDFRLMLLPLTFTYPNKSVEKDEEWEVKWPKGGDDMTVSYQVVGTEKIGDVEAVKISSKLASKAAEGLKADGTWWLSDSKVVKFEVKVANWIVPMAGGEAMTAKLVGTLKK